MCLWYRMHLRAHSVVTKFFAELQVSKLRLHTLYHTIWPIRVAVDFTCPSRTFMWHQQGPWLVRQTRDEYGPLAFLKFNLYTYILFIPRPTVFYCENVIFSWTVPFRMLLRTLAWLCAPPPFSSSSPRTGSTWTWTGQWSIHSYPGVSNFPYRPLGGLENFLSLSIHIMVLFLIDLVGWLDGFVGWMVNWIYDWLITVIEK